MKTMTALEWALGGDTGLSSETLLAGSQGITTVQRPSVPADREDFGRCYRLLERVQGVRENLRLVSRIYPVWAPFVENWAAMERFYECTLDEKDNPEQYKKWTGMLQDKIDEARGLADKLGPMAQQARDLFKVESPQLAQALVELERAMMPKVRYSPGNDLAMCQDALAETQEAARKAYCRLFEALPGWMAYNGVTDKYSDANTKAAE